MKLPHTLYIIFIFLFFNSFSYSNNEFEEGYIVTNDRDTIFGMIKDRKLGTFNKLYSKIIFKNEKGKKRKYGPADILAYKIGYDEFVSLWYLEGYYFFDLNIRSNENKGEKRFFKHIMKGPLNYFYLEYVEENGVIDHSGYYKRENEDLMLFVRTGIFGLNRKQLASYFKDCKPLQKKILDKTFSNPYEIVNYYNDWFVKNNKRSI